MPTTQTAVHRRWNEIEPEAIGGLIVRRFFTGDPMTLSHFELERGAATARHAHEAEEIMCVLEGAVKMTLDSEESIVRKDEFMEVPGGIPHRIEALEDSVIVDIFSPIRRDWLEKTDTYYMR